MMARCFKNKKGGEKLLSIWWFAIIIISTIIIIAGVSMYYSADINVNHLEANALSEKLLNCIIKDGYLDKNLFSNEYDAFASCGLAKIVIENDFYFRISLSDEAGNELRGDIIGGVSSFEGDCAITSGGRVSARHYPLCDIRNEKISYLEGASVRVANVEILAASNQKGRGIATT